MPLSRRLAFQFDKRVQIKGASFSRKAIQVTGSSPRFVYAEVRDIRRNSVRLTYDDGFLKVACDCNYPTNHAPCMALWAAILEAERCGTLQDALKARYLQLVDEEEGSAAPTGEIVEDQYP